MTGLPAWVLQRIATTTGTDPRQGRAARAATCPRCHAPVLRGADADRCAFTVTTDPTPLSVLGELLALTAGRNTFTLESRPPQLTWRDQDQIRHRPPTPDNTVLPEHRCGAKQLPTLTPAPPQRTRKAVSNAPPF